MPRSGLAYGGGADDKIGSAMAGGAPRQRLDSWKLIADHLGRNVRTVIRWEKERGLPVHRVPGGRSRTVFAYTDELDAWLHAAGPLDGDRDDEPDEQPPAWRRAGPAMLVVVVVAAIGVAAWRFLAVVPIDSVVVSGDALVAVSPSGHSQWHYVPDRLRLDVRTGRIWHIVRDLDGRPGNEVIAAGTSGWEEPEAIVRLSNRGMLQWIQSFDGTVLMGGAEYRPPWRTSDLVTFDAGGERRIAWVLHHHTWSPAVIAIYDADGRLLHRFEHHGWLTSAAVTRDGRYVLAAGVSNAANSYVLLALDTRSPGGPPAHYFTLPRSELAVRADLPLLNNAAMPRLVVLPTGDIEVRLVDSPPGAAHAETIFEFDQALRFKRARAGDTYWQWHRRLEQAGLVDHADPACPDRSQLRPVEAAAY